MIENYCNYKNKNKDSVCQFQHQNNTKVLFNKFHKSPANK